MSIKDRMKQKMATAVPASELATLAGEEVQVRKMSLGARGRIMDVGYKTVGSTSVPIFPKLYPILLKETVYDPATGEKVFTSKDDELIAMLDVEEVDKVAAIAFRLAGMDKETGKDLGKESGTSQSSESDSE